MAARRKAKAPVVGQARGSNTDQFEKLTRLIALFVVKGESQTEKIKILTGAGFKNVEIAELLGLTANAVNIAIHRLQ